MEENNKISKFARQISSYVSLIFMLLTFGLFLFYQQYWQIAIILFVLNIFIFTGIILKWKIFCLEFINWFIYSITIVLSSLFIIAFLESDWPRYIVSILMSFIYFIYLQNIHLYLNKPDKYQTNSLENITGYTSLIILFFVYAASFNLLIFLSWPIYYPVAIVFATTFVISFILLWFNKIEYKNNWLYALIFSLVITELFWVFSYLPISYLVVSIVLTIIYYIMFNINLHGLLLSLHKKIVLRFLIIGILSILLILLTAQWV